MRGDRNELGWPDALASARRELREELGLDVPRESIRPAALFLANSTNPKNNHEGQLVAALLSIVRVDRPFSDIESHLWSNSDLATGRYEVDDLEPFPVGTSDADLTAFVDKVASHLDELDQHGAVAAFYVAAVLWDRAKVMREFDSQIFATAGRNPLLSRTFIKDPNLLFPEPTDRSNDATSRATEHLQHN
jgi:hypothetical protein